MNERTYVVGGERESAALARERPTRPVTQAAGGPRHSRHCLCHTCTARQPEPGSVGAVLHSSEMPEVVLAPLLVQQFIDAQQQHDALSPHPYNSRRSIDLPLPKMSPSLLLQLGQSEPQPNRCEATQLRNGSVQGGSAAASLHFPSDSLRSEAAALTSSTRPGGAVSTLPGHCLQKRTRTRVRPMPYAELYARAIQGNPTVQILCKEFLRDELRVLLKASGVSYHKLGPANLMKSKKEMAEGLLQLIHSGHLSRVGLTKGDKRPKKKKTRTEDVPTTLIQQPQHQPLPTQHTLVQIPQLQTYNSIGETPHASPAARSFPVERLTPRSRAVAEVIATLLGDRQATLI